MTADFPSKSLPFGPCSDPLFFRAHPARRFRARPYRDGDFRSDWPPETILFAENGGTLAEVNLVIVKRVHGGRQRILFSAPDSLRLCTDESICEFLRSRGVNQGRGLSPMGR